MSVETMVTRFVQYNVGGLRRDLLTLSGDFAVLEAQVQRTQNIGARVAAIGALGVGAIASLISAAAKSAGEVSKVEMGFETILKSADKAKALSAAVREFDIKTPYSYLETAAVAQQMLASGFRADLIPTMYALGNAIAAAGGGTEQFTRGAALLSKIKATGTIQRREFLQFSKLGIPIKKMLQDELGLSDDQLFNLGKLHISSDVFFDAFNHSAGKMFGGAIEKMQNTLPGALENMKGTATKVLATLGDTYASTAVSVLKSISSMLLGIDKFVSRHSELAEIGLALAGIGAGVFMWRGLTAGIQTAAAARGLLAHAVRQDTAAEITKTGVAKAEGAAISATGTALAGTAAQYRNAAAAAALGGGGAGGYSLASRRFGTAASHLDNIGRIVAETEEVAARIVDGGPLHFGRGVVVDPNIVASNPAVLADQAFADSTIRQLERTGRHFISDLHGMRDSMSASASSARNIRGNIQRIDAAIANLTSGLTQNSSGRWINATTGRFVPTPNPTPASLLADRARNVTALDDTLREFRFLSEERSRIALYVRELGFSTATSSSPVLRTSGRIQTLMETRNQILPRAIERQRELLALEAIDNQIASQANSLHGMLAARSGGSAAASLRMAETEAGTWLGRRLLRAGAWMNTPIVSTPASSLGARAMAEGMHGGLGYREALGWATTADRLEMSKLRQGLSRSTMGGAVFGALDIASIAREGYLASREGGASMQRAIAKNVGGGAAVLAGSLFLGSTPVGWGIAGASLLAGAVGGSGRRRLQESQEFSGLSSSLMPMLEDPSEAETPVEEARIRAKNAKALAKAEGEQWALTRKRMKENDSTRVGGLFNAITDMLKGVSDATFGKYGLGQFWSYSTDTMDDLALDKQRASVQKRNYEATAAKESKKAAELEAAANAEKNARLLMNNQEMHRHIAYSRNRVTQEGVSQRRDGSLVYDMRYSMIIPGGKALEYANEVDYGNSVPQGDLYE